MLLFTASKPEMTAVCKAAMNQDGFGRRVQMEDEIRQIQSILLGMYRDFYGLAESMGINVFLVGGSALGAVRHKGFIPWDDDMDIAMLRNDFEKMERFFAKTQNQWNAYQYIPVENELHPNAPVGHFYRIDQAKEYGYAHAPKLDIHPLDGVPENRFLQKVQNIAAKIYYLYVYNLPTKNKGRLMRQTTRLILFLTPDRLRRFLLMKLKKLITRWNTGTEKEICSLFGVAGYEKEKMTRDIVLPARLCVFEQCEFKVFHRVEDYLTSRYGDYRKLPPEEERAPAGGVWH